MTGVDATSLHALMLVVWVPALVAWRALDGAWARGDERAEITGVASVSALTYVAGLVHVVVLPEHARESVLYGLFFSAAAAGQLGYSALVARRPTVRVLEVGLVAQLALLVLWAATRVVGPPLGPGAWQPEPVGVLDVTCAASEATAIMASLWLLVRRPARYPALV